MMKHFLITRFNIKSNNWQQTKSGALTTTDEWLEQRFTLFETYCLPSVKNQTNQEFEWLIIFDIGTPRIFKNRIEAFAESYTNMTPLYVESFQTLKATLREAILKELTVEDTFIITTRLDNDDAIHSSFVSSIQEEFVTKHNAIIDLVKGYQLIVNDNTYDARYYSSHYNPFISLIEDAKQFETVMAKNHEHWKTLPNRIVFNKKPLWLQVIHSDNILNSKINALKKPKYLNFEDFGLNLNQIKNGYLHTFLFNLITVPKRFFIAFKHKLKGFIK